MPSDSKRRRKEEKSAAATVNTQEEEEEEEEESLASAEASSASDEEEAAENKQQLRKRKKSKKSTTAAAKPASTAAKKTSKKTSKKAKAAAAAADDEDSQDAGTEADTELTPATQLAKDLEQQELLSSSSAVNRHKTMYYIGAHVSINGGFSEAIKRTVAIGGRAAAIFLNGQRQWKAADKDIEMAQRKEFQAALKEHNMRAEQILPHGSYLSNMGSPDDEKLEKSRQLVLREVKRSAQLGLKLYNFHPGSTLGKITEDDCCKRVAASINWCIDQLTLPEEQEIIFVVENTAGQGDNVGYTFQQLKTIIDNVKKPERVGICIDTCHAFAAGYDLRTTSACKKTFDEFDRVIGFKYLKGMHLNDSKGDLGDRKDRHEKLGAGKIGWTAFRYIMQQHSSGRFQNIPLCLETPDPARYKFEIDKLYSFIQEGPGVGEAEEAAASSAGAAADEMKDE